MAIPRWKHEAEAEEQEQQEPQPERRPLTRQERYERFRRRAKETVKSRDAPPTREYTPRQLTAISKFQEARTKYQWGQERRRIDPTGMYLIPNKELMEGGKGYRKLSGEEVLSDIDRSYSRSWKGEVGFRQEIKEYHPGTKIQITDKGYNVIFPYAGAEKYKYYEKKLETDLLSQAAVKLTRDDLFGISSFIDQQRGDKQKAKDTQIKALHKIMTDPVLTAVDSPVAQLPWYFVGGVGIKAGLGYTAGKLALRPVSSAILTKIIPATIGGVMLTQSGLDIKTTFERGDTGAGAGKLTTLGISLAAMGLGYKAGGKLTFKGGLTPKEIGYSKALPKGKDISKLPFLKEIQFFKQYNLDLRIARGMKFGGQPLHGKLPAYLGRRPYGTSRYISTLEQYKGTLTQSGYRGGDPLKASAWKYYHYMNPEQVLSSKSLSSLTYKLTSTGGMSIKSTYNIKLGFPQLATGSYPAAFRIAKTPIAIKEAGGMKGYTYRVTDASKIIQQNIPKTAIQPKTDFSLTTLTKSPGVTTTRPVLSYADPHLLQYLETLEPSYIRLMYPTSSRIGLQTIASTGKIISPTTGLISGAVTGRLSRYRFDSIQKNKVGVGTTIKISGFIKGDRVLDKSNQVLSSATFSSTATSSLTGTATANALKQITKQLTKPGTAYQQSYADVRIPRNIKTDFSDHVPRVKIPIHAFLLPKSLYGRGKKGWFESGELPGYRFREFKLPSLSKLLKKVKL